jgi:hypothetical protein
MKTQEIFRVYAYAGKQGSKEDTTMTTPRRSTLLDLVEAVTIYATSDAEIVATVAYLINTGRVRLCGTFAGARIDLSMLASAAPRSLLLKHVEHSAS